MTQLWLNHFAPSSNIITSTIDGWTATHILFANYILILHGCKRYFKISKQKKKVHWMSRQKSNKIVRCCSNSEFAKRRSRIYYINLIPFFRQDQILGLIQNAETQEKKSWEERLLWWLEVSPVRVSFNSKSRHLL